MSQAGRSTSKNGTRDWAEERVMRFTAQHWPVRRDGCLPTETRLEQDLGMDGEEAVAFFDAFQRDFRCRS